MKLLKWVVNHKMLRNTVLISKKHWPIILGTDYFTLNFYHFYNNSETNPTQTQILTRKPTQT